MPLYFFHLRDRSGDLRPDDVGGVFPDDEAAVLDALRRVKEGGLDEAPEWQGCAFEIHDAEGWHVSTVHFRH